MKQTKKGNNGNSGSPIKGDLDFFLATDANKYFLLMKNLIDRGVMPPEGLLRTFRNLFKEAIADRYRYAIITAAPEKYHPIDQDARDIMRAYLPSENHVGNMVDCMFIAFNDPARIIRAVPRYKAKGIKNAIQHAYRDSLKAVAYYNKYLLPTIDSGNCDPEMKKRYLGMLEAVNQFNFFFRKRCHGLMPANLDPETYQRALDLDEKIKNYYTYDPECNRYACNEKRGYVSVCDACAAYLIFQSP